MLVSNLRIILIMEQMAKTASGDDFKFKVSPRMAPKYEKFLKLHVDEGVGIMDASRRADVDYKTGKKWSEAYERINGTSIEGMRVKGPKDSHQLSQNARKALKDFSYFQERYLGHKSLPWQKIAADTIVKLAASPEEEYLVINSSPGSGKSTLMIHDIGAWLIARDRGIRIAVVSSTQKNAEKFAGQLRHTLESVTPIRADAKLLKLGMGKDAETTLAKDFGRFKPEEAMTWTKQAFRVDRPKDAAAHKENTVEAFGYKGQMLGGRFDVVICDDVQDPSYIKSKDMLDELKTWYDDVAESRLEPGGLMVVNMQRVGANDLSHHCLEMESWSPEDDDDQYDKEDIALLLAEREKAGMEPLPVRDGVTRKYRDIVFKSNFDDECKGPRFHGRSAPAYPDGCLLFPRKLTYQKLQNLRKKDLGKYRLWYQQEQVELGNILVEPVWISGGTQDGVQYPGCWDNNRSVRELPQGLSNNLFSFLAVDPSPSQYWAVGWWVFHQPSNELYLIDLLRQRMTSPQFFDMNPNTGAFSGALVDMHEASRVAGIPLTHVIAEVNVAQRFMYQSSAIQQFLRSNSIALMPHTTTVQNKNSQEMGIQSLQPWWRDGRVRLPGAQKDTLLSRTRSLKLVDEVTNYKLDGTTTMTDDCVLQMWFATRAVTNLYKPKRELPRMSRPSWVGRPNLGVISA